MNIYKKIWDKELASNGMPAFYTGVTKIPFLDFKEAINEEKEEFISKIIKDLVGGKVILIKSAFSDEFVKN